MTQLTTLPPTFGTSGPSLNRPPAPRAAAWRYLLPAPPGAAAASRSASAEVPPGPEGSGFRPEERHAPPTARRLYLRRKNYISHNPKGSPVCLFGPTSLYFRMSRWPGVRGGRKWRWPGDGNKSSWADGSDRAAAPPGVVSEGPRLLLRGLGRGLAGVGGAEPGAGRQAGGLLCSLDLRRRPRLFCLRGYVFFPF